MPQCSQKTINPREGITSFITHDDGARLWGDEALVLDEWGSCCRTDTVDVALSAGTHAIWMEIYDSGGTADAWLDRNRAVANWVLSPTCSTERRFASRLSGSQDHG